MVEVRLVYEPETDTLFFVHNRKWVEGIRHFMEVSADDVIWGASAGDFDEDKWSWSAALMAGVCRVRERIAVDHERAPLTVVIIEPGEICRFKKVFSEFLEERGDWRWRHR